MKNIFFKGIIGLLLLSISNVVNIYAADNIDWDDLKVYYEYDGSDEELSVKMYVEDLYSSPSDDYEVEIEVDNKTYDKVMKYSSSRDELYVTFYLDNVDESDFQDYRDIEIEITNEDTNDTEYDREIRLSNLSSSHQDGLDWDDNMNVSYDYDSKQDRLHIDVSLNYVENTPDEDYRAYIEVDNKEYDERMYYSSSRDQLRANFYISNISSQELKDFFDLELRIRDEDGDTVYRDSIDLDNHGSNKYDDGDIDWSTLNTNVYYEKDKSRIQIRSQINNIEQVGNGTNYDVVYEFDGKTYTIDMSYSPDTKQLYAYKLITVLSESRVKTSYNVGIEILNSNDNEIYSETKNIVTQKKSVNDTSTTSHSNSNTSHITNTNSSSTTSKGEIFAYKYIFRIEDRYQNKAQRIKVLNKMIDILNQARYSYSNKELIDTIIETVEKRIDSYANTSTHSAPKANKAGRYISDGNGGTFYYYGGYNY